MVEVAPRKSQAPLTAGLPSLATAQLPFFHETCRPCNQCYGKGQSWAVVGDDQVNGNGSFYFLIWLSRLTALASVCCTGTWKVLGSALLVLCGPSALLSACFPGQLHHAFHPGPFEPPPLMSVAPTSRLFLGRQRCAESWAGPPSLQLWVCTCSPCGCTECVGYLRAQKVHQGAAVWRLQLRAAQQSQAGCLSVHDL